MYLLTITTNHVDEADAGVSHIPVLRTLYVILMFREERVYNLYLETIDELVFPQNSCISGLFHKN